MSALPAALRNPQVRGQILFTLGILAVFRVGSFLPAPGVAYANVRACVDGAGEGGLAALVNIVSGGALLQLSVFALGIMPYITASIIVQLLRVVIPRFEALHREGSTGRDRLTQYTRYLTIALALLQAATLVVTARSGVLFGGCGGDTGATPVLVDTSWWTSTVMVLTLVAGTGLVMWLAELITERGVGNGMSLLILAAILAALPAALTGAVATGGLPVLAGVLALLLLLVALVAFVEQSQRRIRVTYAKRMVGRTLTGGTSTYLPLKVNMAGVVPVIFASSVLMLPLMAAQAMPEAGWSVWVQRVLGDQAGAGHLVALAALVVAFAFFYAGITFDPDEHAAELSRYGGFVPGRRPGPQTAQHLRYVLNRLMTAGSTYLVLVALVPTAVFALLGVANLPFGGTSLLIVVSVALDTVNQVRARLGQHRYEGLLTSPGTARR